MQASKPNSAPSVGVFDVVRRCARVRLGEDEARELRALAAGATPIDWPRAAAFAVSHAVAPLLLMNVRAHLSGAVPPALLARLAIACQSEAARSMNLARELAALVSALDAAGVRAISFKGPALALSAYGSLALRSSSDLDILVAPADVTKAADVLAERGYPAMNIPPERMSAHLRTECEHAFLGGAGRVTVDLHWQLFRRYLGRAPAFDALWARSARVRVHDADVAVLGNDDLLVMLCQHGSSHAWERLRWVCDVNELLRSINGAGAAIDWPAVFERAAEARTARALRLGLVLAHDQFGAPLPPDVLARCRRDRTAARLARRVTERFASAAGSHSSTTVKVALFQLASRDGWRERIRYCLLAAAPNTRDHRAAQDLPGPARALSALVRPVRLIRRHVLHRA